ncbi:Ubiquitin carboxyl-terminal hydrolase 46 [Lobosporangium transversale]|nr:Ubiquitin carboxyl-terminal hydrolase 46 [Lobosporangium transversale]
MVESMKLAQRMKKNDGSLSYSDKPNSNSKKRRSTTDNSSQEERLDSFAPYGTDAIDAQSILQDEKQTIRNIAFGGISSSLVSSKTSNGASSTSRRRKPLDGQNGGPPPTKKHKPPQGSHPTASVLLTYFTRNPSNIRDTVSQQEDQELETEAQRSLNALYIQTRGVQPSSMDTAVFKKTKESLADQRRIDRLLGGHNYKGSCSNEAAEGSHELSEGQKSTSMNKSILNQEKTIVENKAGESDQGTTPTHSKPNPSLESVSTKLRLTKPGEVINKGDVKFIKSPLTSAFSTPDSKESSATKDIVGIQDGSTSQDGASVPKYGLSMREYFKYRPKPMASLSKATNSNAELISVNDSKIIDIVTKDASTSSPIDDNQSSEPAQDVPSPPSQQTETLAQNLSDKNSDEAFCVDTKAIEEDKEQLLPPRRRRLVRGAELKVKTYCESSSRSSDSEAAFTTVKKQPKKSSKDRKRDYRTREPKHIILSEPESEEEEPEPKHAAASRQFMKNFFGISTSTTSSASTTSQKPSGCNLVKESPKPAPSNDSDDGFNGRDASVQLMPVANRPRPKTYSKAKSGVVVKRKDKSRSRKSSFSNSDNSGSERDNSGLDDDLSDFMTEQKPDPNQKSITTMFSKAQSRPASAYTPILKPRRKTRLTPASRAVLSGGLSNISNTCYLNSILQALRNTRECSRLIFVIQEKMRELEERLGSQVKLTEYQRALFDHALDMFQQLDEHEKKLCEGDAELSDGDSLFNSSEQQDAAEFLLYIISLFDDVLKALLLSAQSSDLGRISPDIIPRNWQPIDYLFQVGTQTVTHCQQCRSVVTKMDRGIDLTVQIDVENPTLVRDLGWGITETMKMEHMKDDNQRFCEKCNSKEDAHIYHYLTSLPKIMILRLQRYNFSEGAVKLQNRVSCTERMNFSKWMSKDHQGGALDYELCAIIVHRGRAITSGHYYVYIKKDVEIESEITEPTGETYNEKKSFRWLKYNDASVDPVSEEDMTRLFSGDINMQAKKSGNLNGYNAAECLATDTSLEASNDQRNEPILNSFLLDDDMATPYVYIYRRLDDD